MEPQSPDEQLMFLYDKLREEIMQNVSLSFQILASTVLFVGTIMTIALSASEQEPLIKALIFALAEITVLAGWAQRVDRIRQSESVAAYMRTFLEPELPGVQWETNLPEFRRHFARDRRDRGYGNTQFTFWLLFYASMGFSIYYAYQAFASCTDWKLNALLVPFVNCTAIWIAAAGAILVAQVLMIKAFRTQQRMYRQYRQAQIFDEAWQKVKGTKAKVYAAPDQEAAEN